MHKKQRMRCIFCKGESTHSRSVEHIIPEALGNTEHVLPPGVVCDTCNNYFARKVEGPLLRSPWFQQLRSRQLVANKRGRIPFMEGVLPSARLPGLGLVYGSRIFLQGRNESEHRVIEDAIVKGLATRFYVPIAEQIDRKLMSRFLAKVAMEAVVHRVMGIVDWQSEIIDNKSFDELRRYARVGDRPAEWPFFQRRLYNENDLQLDNGMHFQILHEFTLLYTPRQEIYVVVCIFGMEFAINCGGPVLDGYEAWLNENNSQSPLYR
ncbi:MAG: HNH endonuclease [Rhodomicrobium sp.]|nr:HNH endonuclease [Rhodomicrobium sp.]